MTGSIIRTAGRYQPEHSDGCVGDSVANRYSEATKASAVHQVDVAGRSPKDVAAATGIPLSTLRRWLKDAATGGAPPSQAAPDRVRLVLLDDAGIRDKLARILGNEGFMPQLAPLRGHALSHAGSPDACWLEHAWLFELPPAGARRLAALVERSGRDVPMVCLDGDPAPERGALLDYESLHCDAAHVPGLLARALDRLQARRQQRAQLHDCQRNFEQLQRCCLHAFDNMANPVAIVHAQGHVYANPAYLRLFGDSAAAALPGLAPTALLAVADAPTFAQALAAVLTGKRADALDVALHDGVRVRVEMTEFPGSSQRVQLILRPYVQAPERSFRPNAAVPATTESSARIAGDHTEVLWEERIRRALRERHLFSIVYQPIVHLGGMADACYEALLRLHDEHGGEFLPASFLPAAERAGLLDVVDQWVIRQAVRQIRSEAAAGRAVRVFVNLSRATLLNPDFAGWLARLLEQFGIASKALVFEVPEAVLVEHVPQCRATLNAARALGCQLALDHFTGAAAVFAVVQDIGFDYLKCDATLGGGPADHLDMPLRLRELTARARAMNMMTIVGRVQDARSVALLWQSGVDYVQGYFLQQPSKALDYDFVNGDYEVATSNQSVF